VSRDVAPSIRKNPQQPRNRSVRSRGKSIAPKFNRPRNLADRKAKERCSISRVEFRLRSGKIKPGIQQQRKQHYREPDNVNADARGH
jgi:hypothetical protein